MGITARWRANHVTLPWQSARKGLLRTQKFQVVRHQSSARAPCCFVNESIYNISIFTRVSCNTLRHIPTTKHRIQTFLKGSILLCAKKRRCCMGSFSIRLFFTSAQKPKKNGEAYRFAQLFNAFRRTLPTVANIFMKQIKAHSTLSGTARRPALWNLRCIA